VRTVRVEHRDVGGLGEGGRVEAAYRACAHDENVSALGHRSGRMISGCRAPSRPVTLPFQSAPDRVETPMRNYCARLAVLFAFACTGTRFRAGLSNRPIKVIIPWPPGQATDLAARMVSEKLVPVLGQPLVMDQQARGGRNDRFRGRVQDPRGRIHLARGLERPDLDQPQRAKGSLRPPEGFRADLPARGQSVRAGRQFLGSGEERAGADRPAARESRKVFVLLVRVRRVESPGVGAVQFDGERQRGARAVQGKLAVGDRPRERPGRLHHRNGAQHHQLREIWDA